MNACKKCGSYAINPGRHGRDNTDQGLCDVCFWRKRAAKKERSLAETQRQIIEAAERRGYERAMSECGRGLEDAERMDWLDNVAHCADWFDGEPTKRVIRASDGAEFTGDTWREAIDAARAAKVVDHV